MRQDAAANSAHEDEVSRARSADQGEGEGGEDGEGKGKSTTVSRILQQISSRLVSPARQSGGRPGERAGGIRCLPDRPELRWRKVN